MSHELVSISVLIFCCQKNKLRRLQPLEKKKKKNQKSKIFSLFFPQRRYEEFFGCHWRRSNPDTTLLFFSIFFQHDFNFPALLVGGFIYPQRASGQAVFKGVHPSPPRYVPLFFSLCEKKAKNMTCLKFDSISTRYRRKLKNTNFSTTKNMKKTLFPIKAKIGGGLAEDPLLEDRY